MQWTNSNVQSEANLGVSGRAVAPSALWLPEVAVAREEKGAVYNVNWRRKKEVDLHVKFIIDLGSRFLFVLNLKKYSDLS